jgi:general secretion pathway protein J
VNGLPASRPGRAHSWSNLRQSGITLLELLVATAVFSIMSAAAYSSLQSSLKAEENFDASMQEVEAVQMSMSVLQRDIMQLSPRAIRDAFGDGEPAMVLSNGRELSFTRGGNFSSLRLDRPELTRVAYTLRDGQLIRSQWRRLDHTQGERPLSASLMDEVSNLQIRVLDQSGIWHLDWPMAASGNIRALEITLEVDGWGEIRRLVPLPG